MIIGLQRALSAYQIKSLQPILERLAVQSDSIALLCGSILQVAKQGLSIVYGDPKSWPSNELLGSQAVSYIIRMARNQSFHYEEGLDKSSTSFKKMEEELGISFDMSKNMARVVLIKALKWRDLETFRNSLLAI